MTWQDELRQLDEELAAGRLPAEDYRRRRDELLAQAASAGPSTPGGGQAAQASADPFPPPFRWSEPPQESTQVMAPIRDESEAGAADSTQVVQSQDGERTQVVPGQQQPGQPGQPTGQHRQAGPQPTGPQQQGGPPLGPPQTGYQGQPPWQQRDAGSAPPWASMDLPPTIDTTPAWFKQGPEVFNADHDSSRGRQALLLVLAVVLAIAVVGGVTYFVAFRPTSPEAGPGTTGATTPPAATTTTKPLTPIEAALAKMPQPPGEQDADNGVLPLAKVAELKLLSEPELQILRDAKVDQVAFRGSIKGLDEYSEYPDQFEAMTFLTTDAATATGVVAKLKAYQEQNGLIFIPDPLPETPASVVFEKGVNPVRSAYRGLYTSGTKVVRLNVVQAPLKDEAALSGSYQRQMRELIKAFEPSS